MTVFQALILGVVQGLTEFLPVSSSAHLVVLPEIFGWQAHSLVFDTTLHLGTSLALLAYFWKDLWEILRSPKKWWFKLFLGMLPAGVLGFLFNDLFEEYFRDISFVVVFLVLGSVLMHVAEKFFSSGNASAEEVSAKKSFLVGLFQSLALFPGFSRSGSTISGGMILGMSREAAAKFSFLLSIPLVWAAGGLEFVQLFSAGVGGSSVSAFALLVGAVSSFLTGVLCIKFFMRFVKSNSLIPFVVYRLLLALALIML
ncbi:undecaprenyl-diphosphatase UppP [candidate division WWE3 bacterium]|nr:undecaprenyl-diphosphatase UppP [candidate division WWE3 bacterium]